MKRFRAWIFVAGWLAIAASAPADIVWSGEQNLSGFEQYIDLNFDSRIDVLLVYTISADNAIPPTAYVGFLNAHVDGYGVDGNNSILIDSSVDLEAQMPYGTFVSGDALVPYEWESGMFASGLVSKWSTYTPNPDTDWQGLLGENGNAYIGISFDVGGETHDGWVDITLGEEGPHGFRLPVAKSWAYESTPDTGIVAGVIPEPSTGILTIGGSLSLLLIARHCRRAKQGRAPLPRIRNPHASTTPEEW